MSMQVRAVTSGADVNPATGQRAASFPSELKQTLQEHYKKYDDLIAKAQSAGNDKEVDRLRGQRAVSVERISGPDGLDDVEDYESQGADAGHAVPVTTNATLWMIGFGYGTGRPREAQLTNEPSDGKLELYTVQTPSSHVGDANFHRFAKTNKYWMAVYHMKPGGGRELIKKVDFEVGDKQNGEYATVSPKIEVDLNKYKGDIRIEGAAHGSAGPGGYIEQRATIIRR